MAVSVTEIAANGFTFRCRTAGDGGEPVILLHGFPETSHMWLPLMERLEAEGYQVLAPDQRGYSPGARPEGVAAYRYSQLASDVVALADARGFGEFHLVGHDHGSGVGWTTTYSYADRVRSWTGLSVPHITAFMDGILNDPERQDGIAMFRAEGVAEAAFTANDLQALKGTWSSSSPEEVGEYLSVFRQEGALTAALNWYRASMTADGEAGEPVGDIHAPTLMMWGNLDNAVARGSVEAGARYMKGPYKFVELDAGHWLIQDEEARVSQEIVDHIKRNPISA